MPTVLSDAQGPFGRNVPMVRRIRDGVRQAGYETPIVVAGGITTFEQAESILQAGDADIVAFARQALADPDWFVKVRSGYGAEVRRCTYTNYCEALDQAHKEVTCKLWDRQRLDQVNITKSTDGRRRLLPPEWKNIGG
jgi:2,4-dienoyl-CoA reductase-like NADH-dependent reductase (Old Yellow Enzyme family)